MRNWIKLLQDWETNMSHLLGESEPDFEDIYRTTSDEELEYMAKQEEALQAERERRVCAE